MTYGSEHVGLVLCPELRGLLRGQLLPSRALQDRLPGGVGRERQLATGAWSPPGITCACLAMPSMIAGDPAHSQGHMPPTIQTSRETPAPRAP